MKQTVIFVGLLSALIVGSASLAALIECIAPGQSARSWFDEILNTIGAASIGYNALSVAKKWSKE